jgi:hypothetical protein
VRDGGLAAMLVICFGARALAAQVETPIPTRYIADRFFAAPVTPDGDTLLLLIDTGGGGMWMIKPALEQLGFQPRFIAFGDDSVFSGGPFPDFSPEASLPRPRGIPADLIGYGTDSIKRGLGGAVGVLGHTWLADRVWVFDYPRRRMSYYASGGPTTVGSQARTIPMTLKNPPTRNDPRIQIEIDGDTVDALLDSGGTATFAADAVAAMRSGPSARAASFAAARLWDAWHARHPSWRVVADAEVSTHASAIEVPVVRIAGFAVGPVWFVKRADAAYDEMLSFLTDRPILAAIGGEALRDFKITLDYPNQRATFERPVPRRRSAHRPR